MATDDDPVLARRARIAWLVLIGNRLGWLLFGLATAAFLVGFAVGYTPALTTFIVACLIIGSAVLAPAIVFGYAVRAAEREEREQGIGQPPPPES
ncbi:MAG: hypothetical protein S0880_14890 [Actinomycetota bacterium]|nr:hypothetical protein [Actinomycetota bacterium]